MYLKTLLCTTIGLLILTQLPVEHNYAYVEHSVDAKDLVRAEIIEVKDGDTVTARIELGWGVSLVDDVRLLDLDAWETSKRRKTVMVSDEEIVKGKIAKEFLADLVKGRQLYCLRTNQREVYGRILTKFYFYDRDNKLVDVSATMKENGHERS